MTVLITTGNDLPGYTVTDIHGEVFGLTVRSRNLGSQIGASLKSLVGGELAGMTKMLAEGREQAVERLINEAEAHGANAIIAFRFDTSELGTTWTEICAYGTAVKVTPEPPPRERPMTEGGEIRPAPATSAPPPPPA